MKPEHGRQISGKLNIKPRVFMSLKYLVLYCTFMCNVIFPVAALILFFFLIHFYQPTKIKVDRGAIIASWKLYPIPRPDDVKNRRQFVKGSTELLLQYTFVVTEEASLASHHLIGKSKV